MSNQEFSDFEEFWPHFLSSHSHPATRWAHVASVFFAVRGVAKAVRKRSIFPLIKGALISSAFATLSHKFIEGNRPQNFGRPLWATRAVLRLCVRTVTGSIKAEIENLPAKS